MPATDAAALIFREVREFARDRDAHPVTPQVTPEEIRARLATDFDMTRAMPLAECLESVMEMMRNWSLQCTHPRYFGLFNPDVHEAGIWADTLVALYNPQVGAWAHSPIATEIERHVLLHLAASLGLPTSGVAAHFTTGGSEANTTALVAALAQRCPAFVDAGAAALGRQPRIYASAEAHHSMLKAARVAGLGSNSLQKVPVDPDLRLNVPALLEQIARDRANGLDPLLIVGTAGTTGAGVIDPLIDVAAVAAAEDVWFHVDAAWGGAAVLAPSLRHHLAGIERADSITWDAHKWLSVPMGAGMFFTRHPDALRKAFSVDASYVPPESEGAEWGDLYLGSLQWSRRFIGLKLFLTMATLGQQGVSDAIEHQAAMGRELRDRLAADGWCIRNETPLPVVCFTHADIRVGRASTAAIVNHVRLGGTAWISDVMLGGEERFLRACITSYRTSSDDLATLVSALGAALKVTRR